nr:MAG TPA: hypothetical protein [Caudoviricetes sp.]
MKGGDPHAGTCYSCYHQRCYFRYCRSDQC